MNDPIIKVSTILEKIDMPYCLIGGYAVAAYGAPRYTADVDFLVSRLNDYLAHLQANLQEENLSFVLSRTDVLDPLGDIITIKLTVPVQLIEAKYTYHYKAIERAQIIKYENHDLKIISPEDLIILKLKAGGPKDLWDVENILSHQEDLDITYLLQQTKSLRVDRRFKGILARVKQE
ncbi:nucleotidyl transferase AbiEii/AbiGii toxin family protein [Moorella sulfitireducens]|uniref:nucleotidyl transferase AbiEii/AbiGii toxin family protein n=1 Tax=Neomoorella sulfitireducens TaxID=2972948 RepID=UPI0021AD20D0|nr:nucleotidyl transferase AbiEii/AbiGii toxin family protein [Moorella sulfitireducens]